MPGTLYVVGTPIGNLGDLSPRAAETLEICDFIAAEDTRVTVKLLNRYNIKNPLISYYEHNKKARDSTITDRLLSGESCALVTDAGMPAISDPGEDLVRAYHLNGIPVVSVPGPTAFATALALSGMNVSRFTFEGFLTVNKPGRREHLRELEDEKRTMVFYEAPHKLTATLRDFYDHFGDRELTIVREITKIHEEVIRTTVLAALKNNEEAPLKGEIVLILAGKPIDDSPVMSVEEAADIARGLISGGMPPTAAAKSAAKQTGLKKADIYRLITGE